MDPRETSDSIQDKFCSLEDRNLAAMKVAYRDDAGRTVGLAFYVLGRDCEEAEALVDALRAAWKRRATLLPPASLAPPAEPGGGIALAMAREWLQGLAGVPGTGAGHALALLERLEQLENLVEASRPHPGTRPPGPPNPPRGTHGEVA